MAARKFTRLQLKELRQLVLETDIQQMPTSQALQYIAEHMREPISRDYYLHLKLALRKNTGQRIGQLHKHRFAYLQLFFDRIDELRNLQKEAWRLIHEHPDDPQLQHQCHKELHQLTISIGNYYDALPSLTSAYATSDSTQPQRPQQQDSFGRIATADNEIPV
jgi:hypothetical protein